MAQRGAMLFGRNTYELMEGAWPAVARGEKAPSAMREWAQQLKAKANNVVSGSRSDFPWQKRIARTNVPTRLMQHIGSSAIAPEARQG
jgi:dihydrofolate reductase